MTALAIIPDAAGLAALDDPAARVVALVEPASQWLEQATGEQAADLLAKVAGIEAYLRQIKAAESAVGAAQIIALRARMRRAEMLERPRGRPPETCPEGQDSRGPTPDAVLKDEHRDRVLLRNREEVERIAAMLRERGEASRGQVLRALVRERRRNLDEEARSITPVEDGRVLRGDRWTVMGGSFVEVLATWPEASVDMIVTDPPYPEEFLPLWGELADVAARVLVENGVMACMSGKIQLPQVLDQVRRSGLRYGWTYCQLMTGQHSRILGKNIAQAHKPWLVLTKGAWPQGLNDMHDDVLPTSAPDKGEGRHWRQTVKPAQYLIEHLSPKGGVVLDPFLGWGTYGVAALQAGRRFLGVELDEGRFISSAERLRDVEPVPWMELP